MVNKSEVLRALAGARDYLLVSQDADSYPEGDTAADLIGRLHDELSLSEGFETVITIPVNLEWWQ